MFALVLRIIADGAKANPDRNLDALPDINVALPLVQEDDKWFAMAKDAAPTVFGTLERAQGEYKDLGSQIFTKEDNVKHVIGVIGERIRKYHQRGCAHQAFIELQVLSPVKIVEQEIDLELF